MYMCTRICVYADVYVHMCACACARAHTVCTCVQLVGNTTWSGAGGSIVNIFVSPNPGGLVQLTNVIVSSPWSTFGMCAATMVVMTSGAACATAAQINATSMVCQSTSYNAAACNWVGTQCTYQGVTNSVFLDLTTCAAGTTITLSPFLTANGQVGTLPWGFIRCWFHSLPGDAAARGVM